MSFFFSTAAFSGRGVWGEGNFPSTPLCSSASVNVSAERIRTRRRFPVSRKTNNTNTQARLSCNLNLCRGPADPLLSLLCSLPPSLPPAAHFSRQLCSRRAPLVMLKPPPHQLISIEADLTGIGLLRTHHGRLRPITANRAILPRKYGLKYVKESGTSVSHLTPSAANVGGC